MKTYNQPARIPCKNFTLDRFNGFKQEGENCDMTLHRLMDEFERSVKGRSGTTLQIPRLQMRRQ